MAAGARLKASGCSFAIIESGREVAARDRNDPEGILRGIGGAGLYSDGKFSFFPSASGLWSLGDSKSLDAAYEWLRSCLAASDAIIPNAPQPPHDPHAGKNRKTGLKTYPSVFISLDDRIRLIESLAQATGGAVRTASRAISVRQSPQGFVVFVASSSGIHGIAASTVIFAGGRFGALDLERLFLEMPTVFRRFEVGMRVEQPADAFIFAEHASTDVKYIVGKDDYSEWRTFCTVRGGEVTETKWDNLVSMSGRADGPNTGLSNFGLNLRFLRPPAAPLLTELQSIIAGDQASFEASANDFLSGRKRLLGDNLDDLFRSKLTDMLSADDIEVAKLRGPCIEGIGYYPDIGDTLKVNSQPMWVAGDATGVFRGLTAALLSGHFAASRVVEHLATRAFVPAFVKQSPGARMTSVFTAQSKQYFYCRDAVCEYVFQQGALPVNPFRVFEYFLGDRVKRDLVRRGNNHLIEMCDELWVFGPVSDGVLFEIVSARRLRKPIRYFGIATYAGQIRQIPPVEVRFEPEVHAAKITRAQLLALLTDTLATDESAAAVQLLLELL